VLQGVVDFGFALSDIITELTTLVHNTAFPGKVSAYLMDKMSTIEYRLSHGVNEQIQVHFVIRSCITSLPALIGWSVGGSIRSS
jgi:DNA polymerase III delta prime subunit